MIERDQIRDTMWSWRKGLSKLEKKTLVANAASLYQQWCKSPHGTENGKCICTSKLFNYSNFYLHDYENYKVDVAEFPILQVF